MRRWLRDFWFELRLNWSELLDCYYVPRDERRQWRRGRS